jgi:hypothetical protein
MSGTEKLFDDLRVVATPAPSAKPAPQPAARPDPMPIPEALRHLPDDTVKFLNELPFKLSLMDTAVRYPHIVNRLCILWYAPRELNTYLTEVLVTDRPDRQGLAFESARELAAMREYVLDDLRQRGMNTSPI